MKATPIMTGVTDAKETGELDYVFGGIADLERLLR